MVVFSFLHIFDSMAYGLFLKMSCVAENQRGYEMLQFTQHAGEVPARNWVQTFSNSSSHSDANAIMKRSKQKKRIVSCIFFQTTTP
jgi:hypothetical protein